ncbi:acyl-CoA dehydrogenase family protein [Nocardioides nitrophenolicus]|uniref:acyl-CoA dehydrogenase family protein n=1 Tax=Nocardioides nitrophenolicus TaxID=60489 RepID=UPI00195BAC3A|nr:acyl-CoA dehydrogenase family protein [Nocardioides nitrophenolicus]MBM7517178.1 alkylation response protein AidB-like acyl-CoA dehydrogenase [Nocardioides nitrophenolicus]
MQWKFSEEQEAYREALRGWLGDVAGSEQVRGWLGVDGGTPDPGPFEQRLVADGMAGVGIDEELGGQGGGPVELAITAEELARAAAPGSAWLATVLAVPALAGRADLATAALEGGHAALVVAAESQPDGPTTVVVDDAGRLSGAVPRVLGADRAALLVVPATGPHGLGLYAIAAAADGVALTPHRLLDRSRSVADVRLDGVAGELLDVDPGAVLAHVADLAGVLVAADALGAMERMLELAVEYSGQRHQFGVPIGSFQAVKHAAATILVDVEAGRSGVYYAAASVAGGDAERALHAAAVKAQVGAAAGRAADDALTMHGAIGYTWEHDLHLYFKRARLDEQLFGAAAAWNERIADRLALV